MDTDLALEPDQSPRLDAAFDAEALLQESAEAPPTAPAPVYELIENAEGRFVIDGATGIITLTDPATAQAEPGSVHPVRVRICDPRRGAYEAAFSLRVAEPLPTPVLADGTDPLARFNLSPPAPEEIPENA